MPLHPLAGKPVPANLLPDIPLLLAEYYITLPDPEDPGQRVAFGTSGHRGTSMAGSFNEEHVLAITQAVCDYRKTQGIDGPLFLGMDTHALSDAAFGTALEVLAANGVEARIATDRGYTPTPAISHAILTHNRNGSGGQADGLIITPSHNPPEDGGIKYNPPTGGPADSKATRKIEARANELLWENLSGVQRISLEDALAAETTREFDYIGHYVSDLGSVLNLEAVREAGIRIGADPMGGSGIAYWEPIAERYGLDLEVVNNQIDPAFGFMRLDRDGRIRMDCSSPYAMAGLVELKDGYDVAFGNDPDFDRHGIVTPSGGLMNPNHYLAVAIEYLFSHRPGWPQEAAIGKTLVSSSMIDRVANGLGRRLAEVPVGFKWFVDGLLDGSYGFGGEESAGASFLRHDGTVWTTDKDGILLCLLAAEITAVTGKDPGEHYADLEARYGSPTYRRIDAPATRRQKEILAGLSAEDVKADTLAGEPVTARLTTAPANGAAIGGLKVATENGWFAARPSGTEDVYKIYGESFKGEAHLDAIFDEAREIVGRAFKKAGA